MQKNSIDEHAILFPVKFTENGWPETLSRIWFYSRPKFRSKSEKHDSNVQKDVEAFREKYQKEVILEMAKAVHDRCSTEKLKKMFEETNDEDKKLFYGQILDEDKQKLYSFLNENQRELIK